MNINDNKYKLFFDITTQKILSTISNLKSEI